MTARKAAEETIEVEPEDVEDGAPPVRRGRGRPPGSKNKSKSPKISVNFFGSPDTVKQLAHIPLALSQGLGRRAGLDITYAPEEVAMCEIVTVEALKTLDIEMSPWTAVAIVFGITMTSGVVRALLARPARGAENAARNGTEVGGSAGSGPGRGATGGRGSGLQGGSGGPATSDA